MSPIHYFSIWIPAACGGPRWIIHGYRIKSLHLFDVSYIQNRLAILAFENYHKAVKYRVDRLHSWYILFF